ncbi:MAG: hypothetical protein GY950_29325 [bacterium]|nr:hypothetical protein [bacterium]
MKSNRKSKRQLLFFLAGNIINRREHSRREGRRLGDGSILEPRLDLTPPDFTRSDGLVKV